MEEPEVSLSTNVINPEDELFCSTDNNKSSSSITNNDNDCSEEVTDEQVMKDVDGQPQSETVQLSFDNFKEIAKYSYVSSENSYFIGCKWSPDGTCLLTNCADYKLRIIDLPAELYSLEKLSDSNNSVIDLKPSLQMKEVGLIYDYAWYPHMSSWDPATCCFICTSSGAPVHLWDAYTGKIRASYRAYDYADEIHAAISLSFSNGGEWIYCGFRNFVKIFDISKPGRQCEVYNLKEMGGQKGIVSCVSENPAVPELFAVGTYSKTIGLYTRSNQLVTTLTLQRSGLTQLQFSSDGYKLFSGARMDNEIICWDIRNLGEVLMSLKRVVSTNQRIYFDLSKDDKYLMTGGTDGNILVWDLQEANNSQCEPKCKLRTHNGCTNGISVHSRYPIIATSSGKRENLELVNDEDDQNMFLKNTNFEDSIKLWWAGPFSSGSPKLMDVDQESVGT